MWPKRGCNSQTKHSASSSKQVMCRTCSLCVLIMERALIQNNFPAGDKKKRRKKWLWSCFFFCKVQDEGNGISQCLFFMENRNAAHATNKFLPNSSLTHRESHLKGGAGATCCWGWDFWSLISSKKQRNSAQNMKATQRQQVNQELQVPLLDSFSPIWNQNPPPALLHHPGPSWGSENQK